MAQLVWMLTRLVARCQFEHSQAWLHLATTHQRQRIKCKLTARCFGRQEKKLVQLLVGTSFKEGEKRTDGFADPSGRLSHETAGSTSGPVNRLSQLPLALPKVRMRKTQRNKGFVTCKAMREFLFGPAQKTFAVLFEVLPEYEGISRFAQQRFTLACKVEIHQGQANTRQPQFLAQHVAVHPELSPMELTLIVMHRGKITPEGFNLFEPILNRIVAIRSAANKQMLVFTRQAYFGLIVCRAPRCDLAMASDAFHRRRSSIEAHVEITSPCGELAQRTYRDFIFHGLQVHSG